MSDTHGQAGIPADIPELDRIMLDGVLSRETYEKHKKGAAEGDPYHLSEFGMIELLNGFYFHDEARRAEGIRYLEEAIAKGMGSNATFFGFCCRKGDYGFPKDPAKAMEWFRKGAALEDAVAEQILQDSGEGPWQEVADEPDPPEGETGGEGAESAEKPRSYLDDGLTTETYELLRKAAAEGDPVARYELGMVEVIMGYRQQDQARVDEGMRSLEDAAFAGNGPAATFLGTIFHEGKYGKDRNMDLAVMWYKLGADRGDPLGMSNYGIALQRGDGGVQRNDAAAFRWIKKAADAGLDVAQYNTALALYAGRGVKVNRKAAKRYFQLAAKNGIEMAKMWLYSEDYKE